MLAVLVLALAALSTMAAAQAPPPPPAPASGGTNGTCEPLKLRVCGGLLSGLLPGAGGQCCPLLGGLVGLDAAACLCVAIRNNTIPGIINFFVPLGLGLLLNHCGNTTVPAGVSCPPAAA